MRPIALLLSLFVMGSPAFAAVGPESLAADRDLAFSGLAQFKPSVRVNRLQALQAKLDLPARATTAKQKYVRISGTVNLSGSQYVPNGTTFVYITLTGYSQLRDDSGHFLGQVQLMSSDSYSLNGNFVSGWARPYANVAIYDSGRYLGTIRVDGNISVSGYNNGGWVNLNGFGTVSGAGYIDDPSPTTP